jgi:hypothetical protein
MLLSGLHGPKSFAFTLDEHEQSRSDGVVARDDEVAGGPDDAVLGTVVDHERALGKGMGLDGDGAGVVSREDKD